LFSIFSRLIVDLILDQHVSKQQDSLLILIYHFGLTKEQFEKKWKVWVFINFLFTAFQHFRILRIIIISFIFLLFVFSMFLHKW